MNIMWSCRAIGQLILPREYIAEDSEKNGTLAADRILTSVALLGHNRRWAGLDGAREPGSW